MDASLVNVFVSELFKFKTAGQQENVRETQKPQNPQIQDADDYPKLTNDELTQLQDQMRKVMLIFLREIFQSLFASCKINKRLYVRV